MVSPLWYRYTVFFPNGDHSGEADAIFTRACPFCGKHLTQRYSEYGVDEYWNEGFTWESWACLACGWWWRGTVPERSYSWGSSEVAVLHKTSDVPDEVILAILEVRRNSGKLFEMAPRRFEKHVGDILKEFYACEVTYTGQSHDGGIDLLLVDSNFGHIPIQVKRRSQRGSVESVGLVREFRGAMLLKGYDRGKIVTTADHFSRKAVEASVPQPQHLAPQEIDLVDLHRLLDIMKLLCATGGGEHLQDLCQNDVGEGIRGIRPPPDVMRRVDANLEQFASCVRLHAASEQT